jgi:hypothetical protein
VIYLVLFRLQRKVITTKAEKLSSEFQYLASYLEDLKSKNPGSVVTLQTKQNSENNFEFVRLFILFHSCAIVASNCRPVACFDAAHFKNKIWGPFRYHVYMEFFSESIFTKVVYEIIFYA